MTWGNFRCWSPNYFNPLLGIEKSQLSLISFWLLQREVSVTSHGVYGLLAAVFEPNKIKLCMQLLSIKSPHLVLRAA